MKNVILILLSVLMLFGLFGCSNDAELAATQAEIELLKAELDALAADRANATAEPVEVVATAVPTPEPKYVYALQSTILGESVVSVTEPTDLTAEAILPEGKVVDHWKLNDEVQADAIGSTFSFRAEDTTVVEPFLRDEKKVVAVNAELYFVDEKYRAKGDPFTEFVFEAPYTNPVTNAKITDGTVTVLVSAIVPRGYEVDYWLINGVPYRFDRNVDSFVVENLDEATVYEVVLKEEEATYYQVTCSDCSFNGKTSGKVKAGTKITVSARGGYTSRFYVNGSLVAEYKTSITLTINSDTNIECYAIIN